MATPIESLPIRRKNILKKKPLKKQRLEEEEHFHDKWAQSINLDDLCVYEAFEGPVSPEYSFAINLLGELKGKKVLNVGCGAGEESIYLAQKGAKVWGTDLSSGMIEVSKQLAKKFKITKNLTFKAMDAEDLKFPDETFDLIFGNSVLHHLDNVGAAAKEFKRVLKKGGKGVFLDPLAYNPIINLYRKMAMGVRTNHEHPLTYQDINQIKKQFKNLKYYQMHLFTLLIFCWFYIGEGIHPNDARYWKKIIQQGKKYQTPFKILYWVDNVVLKTFPFLRKYCWVVIVEVVK